MYRFINHSIFCFLSELSDDKSDLDKSDLKQEMCEFLDKLNDDLEKLMAKHKDEILALSEWKAKNEKQAHKYTVQDDASEIRWC